MHLFIGQTNTPFCCNLEIAKNVFDECIFLQLENMGLVKVNKEYKKERIRSVIECIIPNVDKIDLLKNKLFTFKNFKKTEKLLRLYVKFQRIGLRKIALLGLKKLRNDLED